MVGIHPLHIQGLKIPARHGRSNRVRRILGQLARNHLRRRLPDPFSDQRIHIQHLRAGERFLFRRPRPNRPNQGFDGGNDGSRRNNLRKESNQRGKRTKKTKSYCCSHGVTRNMDHNSGTCDNQKTGHQIDATIDNRMGRSDRICRYRQNYNAPAPAN